MDVLEWGTRNELFKYLMMCRRVCSHGCIYTIELIFDLIKRQGMSMMEREIGCEE